VRLPAVSPALYRRMTTAALLAVCAIIITGAAVRLTDSGLGCSDWPNCTRNHLVAKLQFHQQVEFVNRVFTAAIAVAIAIAVLGALARVPRRRDLVWWSLGLVAGLLGEIVLGGIVVKSHLWPPFVAAHFLLSALLVWDAVVLYDRARHSGEPGAPTVDGGVVWLGRVMVAAAGVVLVTGTVVTGTGPHGGDQHVKRLPFEVESVARVHSLCAWGLLLLTVVAIGMLARAGATTTASRRSRVLVAAVLVQGAIGYIQYFTGVPPWLVLFHVTGAVVVWVSVLRFQLGLFAHPVSGRQPVLVT
jgi:cytochrome c oxidase assembly protein subunit 15